MRYPKITLEIDVIGRVTIAIYYATLRESMKGVS